MENLKYIDEETFWDPLLNEKDVEIDCSAYELPDEIYKLIETVE